MKSITCLMLLASSVSLINCGVIDEKDDDFDAVSYLEMAGYLDVLGNNGRYHAPDNIKRALGEFQQYAGLPITERLDKPTVEKMREPRCGVPDVVPPSKRLQNQEDAPVAYTFMGGRWEYNDLKYQMRNFAPNIPQEKQLKAIQDALKLWSDVTPLTFREGTGNTEIDISFVDRYHNDGYPFDGPGTVLAHAFGPGKRRNSGKLHFDSAETWSLSSKWGTVNMYATAAHEIGHTLGLKHSTDKKAIMYPWYQETPKLGDDDITGIQLLYGKLDNVTPKPTVSVPKPKPTDVNYYCYIKFDAMEQVHTGSVFGFYGSSMFNITEKGAMYLGEINNNYRGAPSSPGAVLYDYNNGQKTFFFKGQQVWRFTRFHLDTGYPKALPSDFHNIDAATKRFNKIYIFQGNTYSEWDESMVSYRNGYPKTISSFFRNAPNSVDAVFQSRPNGVLNMFQGKRYWRYTFRGMQNGEIPKPGYPKSDCFTVKLD